MPITKTSIQRPVTTTMVYLIIITLGILGFQYLPVDLLPPIEYPRLTVATDYPNVGPEEIETIITKRVENTVSGVPGVEQMRSNSEEGDSRVSLEFAQGTDIDVAANDVRAALDRIRDDLPREAETPRIWKFDPNNFPIVIIGVHSDTKDLQEITRTLEREINSQFEQIAGVGAINVWGGFYREIQVELNRDKLLATGLTATDIQQALSGENVNLPGGNVREGIKNLYVRTKGEYESIEQIEQTVIKVVDGKPVRVGDVAAVWDGYEDLEQLVRIDGKPMVRFGIRKQTGANTVAVAEEIREEVQRINEQRSDLQMFVTTDQSEFIQRSINNVQTNALWGALLALIVLYLFLRNRSSTMIIATSIPISIIATFGLLYFGGLTLNQMSFGGLALGVGLIVDNAIVVLENIVRLREEEERDLQESSLIGTRQVAGAIVASTLTTSVIFLPVVFMQTVTGIMFQELALVVVFSLLCSLFVALTLVPMLTSRFLSVKPLSEQDPSDQGRFQRWFRRFEGVYSQFLGKALKRRKTVFGLTALALGICVLVYPLIPFELAPQIDADQIEVETQMAQGMNIAVMDTYYQDIERVVKSVLPMEDVEHLTIESWGGDLQLEINLKGAEERSIKPSVLADRIREKLTGLIPGADVRVQAESGLWILNRIFSSGGSGELELELIGYDLKQAERIAQEIKHKIEPLNDITGVRVGRREGRPEENFVFNREKIANLGLSVQQVARVIQTNVGGSQAGVYREGGDEFPITVRLRPEDRLSRQDLDNISVRTPGGQTIPVSSVVNRSRARGPTEIDHINGQRVTRVTANLKSGVALGSAVEQVQGALSDMNIPDDFTLTYGGQYEEQQEAQRDFQLAILMALILIYMVMAGQFERFLDPLIVMVSVPLAIIGVIPMLLLTGTTFNMQSLMGVVMLIGIVVNNAIVLVDYINLLRRERNMSVYDAVIEGGRLRLRPILMTTLTTILGLIPLSLGWGSGAELQAALARSVIGGLTASTLVTLVLIPVVYISVEDVKAWARERSWSAILLPWKTRQQEA